MRLCSIDIGTNSTVLTIAEIIEDDVSELYAESQATRLGRNIVRTGYIDRQAARRTMETISDYKVKAKEYSVDDIIVRATSALRRAVDSRKFISDVKRESGLDIEIIEGEDEAKLIHLATTREFSSYKGNFLTVDVGGGSTEIICDSDEDVLFAKSLDIGAVGLSERFVKGDMISREGEDKAISYIEGSLSTVPNPGEDLLAVGTGGTFTTLQSVNLKMESYTPEIIHRSVMSYNQVESVYCLLKSVNLTERKNLKGLPEERADIIPIGSLIVLGIMKKFGLQEINISDRGLRWGMIYNYLIRMNYC